MNTKITTKRFLLAVAIASGMAIFGVNFLANAYIVNPSNSTSIGASSTESVYIDGNRGDTYTANGSVLNPYKTLSTAITSVTGTSPFVFFISPGTYVDGPPDTWPTSSFAIFGNEATYVPASGATFPGPFDIYDLTVAGNITESHNSLNTIHQFNNGVITGNITLAGNATLQGMAFPTVTSTISSLPGSLVNILGTAMYGNIIADGIQTNFNDDYLNPSTGTLAAINSTTTGAVVITNGLSLIQSSSLAVGITLSNGATSTPNIINALSVTVNTSTAASTINAGTAATVVCDLIGSNNFQGTFIAPSGTNWQPCYDENRSVLNAFSFGTSTMTTNLVRIASPSSTIKLGIATSTPGCIEMFDAGTGSQEYVYSSSSVLIATTTKPSFCQ